MWMLPNWVYVTNLDVPIKIRGVPLFNPSFQLKHQQKRLGRTISVSLYIKVMLSKPSQKETAANPFDGLGRSQFQNFHIIEKDAD